MRLVRVMAWVPYNVAKIAFLVTTSGGSGPNGQFTWLTCGIDPNNNSSGWQPPHATVDQIITFPGGLRAAVQDPNSPFSACTRFVELFETAGAEFQGL